MRVVCGGYKGQTIIQDGYPLTKLPITSPQWKKKWLEVYRPNPKVHEFAQEYFKSWQPDVIFVGALQHLTEFALMGKALGIPLVQTVHDYTILCLRQWLVDGWGENCDGPTSVEKCANCIRHSLGHNDRIKDTLLSFPFLGPKVLDFLGEYSRFNIHVNTVVSEAFSFMKNYRDVVTLFIAQTPLVADVLNCCGVKPSRIRLLPQYIGEKKLRCYSRAEGRPGIDRPVRFAYVGRWSEIKGCYLLLDAFLSARTSNPMELWIISTNAKTEEIVSLAQPRLNKERMMQIFTDKKGEDVSRMLALADVCVVPSTWMEVAARVVLEANAQGVPVIASSTVGNRYVIEDGMNGRIFPAGDVHALKACIEEIVRDPSMISRWAKRIPMPMGKEEWFCGIEMVLKEAIQISSQESVQPPLDSSGKSLQATFRN